MKPVSHSPSTISSGSRLRIIVLGYIVRGPLGGLVWHHLQYVLGLQRMGHEVLFVEDSNDYPGCYNPVTSMTGTNPDYGLQFIQETFDLVGIKDGWAYHDAHSNHWYGPAAQYVLQFCTTADLLLNLSAVNPLREWLTPIPKRALIDTDPVFTQINHIQSESARLLAQQHTHYFSFGENFGLPTCTIPDDGFPWRPTRQPIVTDCWHIPDNRQQREVFTSILQWDSYPEKTHNGQRYGMKSQSFMPLMALPAKIDAAIELAIGSDNAPRTELKSNHWQLTDPLQVTKTAQRYRDYIHHSKAEFSIAKHGYVVSNSGWFSERSANYLASGRPVITQHSGFSTWLHADRGVLHYTNAEDAAHAIAQVTADYSHHCQAATDIAHEYFDHEKVLSQLLEQIFTHSTESEAA